MKKTLITLLVLVASVTGIQAQNLYKTVYDKAMAVVNNPASSDEEIQINQFKVTALNYMSMMVKKRGLEKDSYFYDSQAVNLASFVTDFPHQNVQKSSKFTLMPASTILCSKIPTKRKSIATSTTKGPSLLSALTQIGKRLTIRQPHLQKRLYANIMANK